MMVWKKTEQLIVENITSAEVVYFDEIGLYVDKKCCWLYVAGILPHFTGKAIHEAYRSYFTYEQCDHGLCHVHHGRDLIFETE